MVIRYSADLNLELDSYITLLTHSPLIPLMNGFFYKFPGTVSKEMPIKCTIESQGFTDSTIISP